MPILDKLFGSARGVPKLSPSSTSSSLSPAETHAREVAEMENALFAGGRLMNDDIDGAEAQLLHYYSGSAYNELGLTILAFMQAMLGFEPELMREAYERTRRCEKLSAREWKAAVAEHGTCTDWTPRPGQFYPPGTGLAVINAASQLMHGATGMLDDTDKIEKVGAAFKGFFKLRKAYSTLNEIFELERREMRRRNPDALLKSDPAALSFSSSSSSQSSVLKMPGGFDDNDDDDNANFWGLNASDYDPDVADFVYPTGFTTVKAGAEKYPPLDIDSVAMGYRPDDLTIDTTFPSQPAISAGGAPGPPPNGSHSRSSSFSPSITRSSSFSPTEPSTPPTPAGTPPIGVSSAEATAFTSSGTAADPLMPELTNPIDVFVHSGVNVCYGALQLILGIVPPAYRPFLSMVGFHGDRDTALRMLWRATTHANFNGALSALILISYYTALSNVSDISPNPPYNNMDIDKNIKQNKRGDNDDYDNDNDNNDNHDDDDSTNLTKYPERKCAELLANVRTRYPDSLIWRLAEGRVLGDTRRLRDAIRVLSTGPEPNMRQVTALTCFEIALDAMFVRDWPLMRDSFLRCVELNDWTHALYFYCAGAAELEMYRDARMAHLSADECERHKLAAQGFFRRVPPVVGQRRLLMKRIPHEVFVERRVARWEQRAKSLGIDFADAVATSPAQEMVYIWNGSKRMTADEARSALGDLRWERCTAPTGVIEVVLSPMPEEKATRALYMAPLLRTLGYVGEARVLLREQVLCYDRSHFKKEHVPAMARYEMAVLAWIEATTTTSAMADDFEFRRAKFYESRAWLNRVMRWGDRYLMDARFGVRFQTAANTHEWYKRKMGWE